MVAPRNAGVCRRSFAALCKSATLLRILNISICCCAVALISVSVSGQSNVSGRFFGVVRDKVTRSVIPDATATFKNLRTGSLTTARSGADGQFSYAPLPPDDYEIEVKADGYLPRMQRQILTAMQPTPVEPIPFDLVKETIAANPTPVPPTTDNTNLQPTPTPTAPPTETESISLNPSRGAAFDIRSVQGLPLGGTTLTRTFDELAFLVPGVYLPPQAIGNTVGPGIGGGVGTSGQFSVNGLRSRANNFTVDGSDNNDEDIGVRRQGFFTLVPQPIESVQEFQIVTLLAPAQYGRNLGAQVNAVSKGGGNDFHGIIYGIGNADFLNARNFFDNAGGNTRFALTGRRPDGTQIPVLLDGQPLFVANDAGEKDDFSLLQGGFAIGGPIAPDRLFFFASGEGQTMNGTRERHFAVPSLEDRGLFGTGAQGFLAPQPNGSVIPLFPGNFIADSVYSLFPFPNDPGGVYGRNTYTKALPIDARGAILSGRVDYNFFRNRERPQTFTARYNFTNDRRDLTDVGGALFSAIRPRVRTDNLSTYLIGGLSDTASNEFRFSYGRTRLRFEELRDDFLSPVQSLGASEDTRFLLNARYIDNQTAARCSTNTLSCAPSNVVLPTSVRLVSSQFDTEDISLGSIGQVIIGGFSPAGVDVFNFPQQRENKTFQFADTIRWQIGGNGQHSLATGADIRRTVLKSDLPLNSRSLVTFYGGSCTNPATFCPRTAGYAQPLDFVAAGAPTGFFQSLRTTGKDSSIDLGYYQLNFFVQDEWRVSPNLNISLGLRYELNTTPKEADRKIEDTFDDALPSFLSGRSQFLGGRSSIYESDKNNFAPRLGFAYAPAPDTVIRGGFGVYYDQILGAVVSQSRNVFPTFINVNFGGGAFQGPNSGLLSLFNPKAAFVRPDGSVCTFDPFSDTTDCFGTSLIQPGTLNTINPDLPSSLLQTAFGNIFAQYPAGSLFGITLPARKLNDPLSYQYSLGVERRLFGNTFLSAAYVGTTGRNLLRFTTPNLGGNFVSRIDGFFLACPQVIFGSVPCQPVAQGSTMTFAPRPVANAGAISQFETTGRSRYNSLQVELRGRLSQRFQYRTNYVYGSSKDDVSDVFDLAGAFAAAAEQPDVRGRIRSGEFRCAAPVYV